MGDPRKQHKKFSKPGKPWEKERIEEEIAIMKEFGLKNKREIWRASSKLRTFFAQAKKAISVRTSQGEKEKAQLLKRLSNLGLIKGAAQVEDVLSLGLKDILQRRLQSILVSKSMARTMKQARQFIVHEHIMVNGRKITVPGYIVPVGLENTITFAPGSDLARADHPERSTAKEIQEVKERRAKKKKGKEIKVKRKRVVRSRGRRR